MITKQEIHVPTLAPCVYQCTLMFNCMFLQGQVTTLKHWLRFSLSLWTMPVAVDYSHTNEENWNLP